MKCTSETGVSLGILLLASLKSASSDPVSSGGAVATSDSGGSFSSPCSERETQKRFGKMKIRYKNECNKLASRDTPSCAWRRIVLEKPSESDEERHFPVKPKCVEIPREYLVEADCHEYYQQDPRKSDVVLGKCAPDLFYNENPLWATDAPLNGTGTCLDFMSDGCESNEDEDIDNKSTYTGDGHIMIPKCFNFDPTTNKCPDKMIVESGPQEAYVKANRGPFNL